MSGNAVNWEVLHTRNPAGLDLCQNDPVGSRLRSGSQLGLADEQNHG